MPRNFFTLQDGRARPDGEGVVLSGPDKARAEAVATAGQILSDLGSRFWKRPEWRMQVTDEHGRALCTLCIRGRVDLAGDEDLRPEPDGEG